MLLLLNLNTSSLVTTTVHNTKISAVENKIPNHDKYVTTPEFNKLTAESFSARLKQANRSIQYRGIKKYRHLGHVLVLGVLEHLAF